MCNHSINPYISIYILEYNKNQDERLVMVRRGEKQDKYDWVDSQKETISYIIKYVEKDMIK